MTLLQYIREHIETILYICTALGIGFELSPQPIKPFTFILHWIGDRLNEDTVRRIESLDSAFKRFQKEYDDGKINNIRKEIVDFSISCQKDELHTPDDFDRIFSRITDYHDLLNKYGLENGKIDIEVNYIEKTYQYCLENHKFFRG